MANLRFEKPLTLLTFAYYFDLTRLCHKLRGMDAKSCKKVTYNKVLSMNTNHLFDTLLMLAAPKNIQKINKKKFMSSVEVWQNSVSFITTKP